MLSIPKGGEDVEERFSSINIDVPLFPNPASAKGKKEIQRWLGHLSGTVFSRGFKLYVENKLNKKQMRAFCCENMIHNIMNLIRRNNLQTEQVEFINTSLKEDIIPSLLSKYPKSEDSEVNLRLFNLIREVDTSESNENDLVAKSGIKFRYK